MGAASHEERVSGTRILEKPLKLKQVRKQYGDLQGAVCERTGLSQSRISRIENADVDTLNISTIRRYVTGLGGVLRMTVVLPDGTEYQMDEE